MIDPNTATEEQLRHHIYYERYKEKHGDVFRERSRKYGREYYKNHRQQIIEKNKKFKEEHPYEYRMRVKKYTFNAKLKKGLQ